MAEVEPQIPVATADEHVPEDHVEPAEHAPSTDGQSEGHEGGSEEHTPSEAHESAPEDAP